MAQEYFSDLNYTLANEDTKIEYDLLPERARNVFCIAGSGSRVLPLIARHPETIEVVDMSVSQLYLTELRYQSAKALSYDEWLFFLGYRGAMQSSPKLEGDDREVLFERLNLTTACREYWQSRREGWKSHGFILLGRWESHFQMLGKVFRDYLRCDFTPIFEAQSLIEQKELWQRHWPKARFNAFMRVAASEFVFNKFLYKGHFAGGDDRRTESRPPYQFLQEEFHRLFHTMLARKSYFLQVLFLGKVRYEEGLPFEAHEQIFNAIKTSPTRLVYRQGNLLEVLPTQSWDFVSLSDTVSYLAPADANSLLQKLSSKMPRGSRVVIRSFMKGPTDLNAQGWDAMTQEEIQAWHRDVTGVYLFHIYRKSE